MQIFPLPQKWGDANKGKKIDPPDFSGGLDI